MRLEVSVHLYGAEVPACSWTLTKLDQAESIGAKVGRVVRDWVRQRPIRKGGTHLALDVRCKWQEDGEPQKLYPQDDVEVPVPKPRRKKRAR